MLYGIALRSVARGRSFRLRSFIRTMVDAPFCSSGRDVRAFGKDNVWNIFVEQWGAPDTLVIYSGGVGKDISTEVELCSNFDCIIYLYDPSPTGIETMHGIDFDKRRIAFSPLGLAGSEGPLAFASPDIPLEGSFRSAGETSNDTMVFPCVRLSNEIKRNGHALVHLLKLDVEGFEYEILDDVLGAGVTVDQICIEFHHFLSGRHPNETKRALRQLREHGYVLIHKSRYDYTFVRRELLTGA